MEGWCERVLWERTVLYIFLKNIFVCVFTVFDRCEEGESKEEKHQCERATSISCLCMCTLVWGPTHNPGMCPDWELDRQPFALQDDTQPTEPHWSGPVLYLDFGGVTWIYTVIKLHRTTHAHTMCIHTQSTNKAGKIWISSSCCGKVNLLVLTLYYSYAGYCYYRKFWKRYAKSPSR